MGQWRLGDGAGDVDRMGWCDSRDGDRTVALTCRVPRLGDFPREAAVCDLSAAAPPETEVAWRADSAADDTTGEEMETEEAEVVALPPRVAAAAAGAARVPRCGARIADAGAARTGDAAMDADILLYILSHARGWRRLCASQQDRADKTSRLARCAPRKSAKKPKIVSQI